MISRCLILVSVVALLAGCQNESFRSQALGEVEAAAAFQAAKDVFAGYYTITSADPAAGRIEGEPKLTASRAEPVFSTAPTREVPVLRIRSQGNTVWADVRVAIQRQEAGAYGAFSGFSAGHEIPNATPAQEDAPLTEEQNRLWRDSGYNLAVEQRILADLYNRLHPKP